MLLNIFLKQTRFSTMKFDIIKLYYVISTKKICIIPLFFYANDKFFFNNFTCLSVMNHLKYILFFILFINVPSSVFAQKEPKRKISITTYQEKKDSLLAKYNDDVIFPDTFQLECLIALSYYPELEDATINFKHKGLKTTMASRPALDFLFRKRENRHYNIVINNNPERIKGALLDSVPFNARVGVIGHELGHVVDYQEKNVLQIIATGFNYLFVPSRRKLENSIDRITIEHSLGWQIYDFSYFVLHEAEISKQYKQYKRKIYFTPRQILRIMKKMPEYQATLPEEEKK